MERKRIQINEIYILITLRENALEYIRADFAAAFTAANTAVAAANTTETTATVFYNLQFDATNGYLFEDIDADGDVDQVIILTGIDNTSLAPADIVA